MCQTYVIPRWVYGNEQNRQGPAFWGTAKKQIMEGQPQTWPYRKVIFSKATTKIIITCQSIKILQEVYLSMSVCSVTQLLLKMLSINSTKQKLTLKFANQKSHLGVLASMKVSVSISCHYSS